MQLELKIPGKTGTDKVGISTAKKSFWLYWNFVITIWLMTYEEETVRYHYRVKKLTETILIFNEAIVEHDYSWKEYQFQSVRLCVFPFPSVR